jgi:hypothetical protein
LHKVLQVTTARRPAELHGKLDFVCAVFETSRTPGGDHNSVVQFLGAEQANKFPRIILGVSVFPLAVKARRKLIGVGTADGAKEVAQTVAVLAKICGKLLRSSG